MEKVAGKCMKCGSQEIGVDIDIIIEMINRERKAERLKTLSDIEKIFNEWSDENKWLFDACKIEGMYRKNQYQILKERINKIRE